MIAQLTGIVQSAYPDYIVLQVGGIGFKVITPTPYLFPIGSTVTLYTSMNVQESAIDLYGFKDFVTKELFERLITVSGIGPKTACAILSSDTAEDIIAAIERGDTEYLTRFPKIGPKTAQQIILDLRGKLHQEDKELTNPYLDEALEALLALGYTTREIMDVKNVLRNEEATSTQDYITKALKWLRK